MQGILRFLGRNGGQTFPVTLQIGSASLPLRAFCDTGFSVQEPPGAGQQQPRREGKVDAEIVGLCAGQEHGSRQRKMKGCEPCQKPQKTPPARKPIAKQDFL